MFRSITTITIILALGAPAAIAAPPPSLPGGHARSAASHAKPKSASGSQITLNLKDADIREVAQMVSTITGKNFIVDPRAQGRVTVISAKPISANALFSVFLSVLNVHGLAAMPSGHDTWKIVPAIEGRQGPGVENTANAPGDAMITRVFQLHNVTVAQLVPALRPLMSSQAQLAAYAPSNMLIISGRVDNVARIIRLAHRLDQPLDANFSLIKLQYASAVAISQVLTNMLQKGNGQGKIPMKLAADPRTNSILVSGSPAEQLQVKALVEQLDQPTGNTGDTHVIYLHYAKAKDLAKILQGYAKAQEQKQKAAAGSQTSSQPAIDVISDDALNALIVTAPPKPLAEIRQIIKELDVRRAQVLVQGIIAELSSSSAAQLGISWAALSSGVAGVTNFPNGVSSLAQLAQSVSGASSGTTGVTGATGLNLPGGLLFGVGHILQNGTGFVALLNALSNDSHTNILSTPSLVMLDNEKAKLVSGQKVPFVTGQYTNTGSNTGSSTNLINPFQTVNREQLGLNLEITPQINYGGDTVTLKIDAKNSSIGASVQGAAGLVTNDREVQTTVIAKNHQIIVLGGLIDTNLTQSKQKVPLLGDIPLLGNLFRYRSSSKSRQNLMIFLRPSILRNADDTRGVTNSRYNEIRELQMGRGPIPLLPGATPPVLPELNASDTGSTGAPEMATLIMPASAATSSRPHARGGHHGQHR